ncbi:MAG TPA: OmpA family protein [Parafilimonas sp.]|nr:OmpA family protein [Parafilimonas sp.]
MKKLLFLAFLFTGWFTCHAQSTSDILKQQAGEGVKEGASVATQQTVNKVTDKVLDKLFTKKVKNTNSKKDSTIQAPVSAQNNSINNSTNNNQTSSTSINNNSTNASLETYSKYDFIPGDKILVYEDFSQDAIGDSPDKWNSNSGSEVVTVSNQTGHWLMINKRGLFMPERINNLPDNFTLEFDLMYVGANPFLQLLLLTGGTGSDALKADIDKRSGVNIGFQPIPRDKGGLIHINSYNDGENTMDNQVEFQDNGDTKIKVSIWRQMQRLRVYLNQEKVFDLPHAFPESKIYNMAMFETWSEFEDSNKYLIGNIKLAAGEPDTRNKLITEGKFSTTGILFDVNSAVIKPESYGSIKDIASVLQSNSDVRVKIIGHTDNDGDATMNIALSKKRADAVKSFLISEFSINASRLETDGKGASEPVAPNTTSEGKAQNRRVEFVKL